MKYYIAAFLLALALPGFSQGTLTPPGAPAPTMKTLAQIEPRTPVESLGTAPPYVISQPGSYYLSANMVTASEGNAILIEAENVTLDLNGFTISSPPGGVAVYCIGSSFPAVIKNGFIRGNGIVTDGDYTQGGFGYGIHMPTTGGTVTDLIVQGCSAGISTNGTVSRCQVSDANTGIIANTVTQSTVKNCSQTGVFVNIGCSESNGEGYLYGIYAPNAQIDQCVGTGTTNTGIVGNDVSRSKGTGAIIGIEATNNVSESTGTSTRAVYGDEKQYGIKCKNAISSTGISAGITYSFGIYATDNVSNSTGTSTYALRNFALEAVGISCSNASNSQGIGISYGIRAYGNATNCYGKAGDNVSQGMKVDGTASFCRGDHFWEGAVAIDANVAMGCTSAQGRIKASIAIGCTSAYGVIVSPSKHLGTP